MPGNLVALEQPVDPHFDPRQLAAFFGRDERVGHAFASHAAGAADAVDVVVAELRNVVVDDVRDARSRRCRGRRRRWPPGAHLARAEAGHHAVAGALRQVAVNAGRRP